MSNIRLLTVALLALSQGAFAQTPPTPPLGGQIQQIPPAPTPQRASPEIRIEPAQMPATPDSDRVKVLVRSLRVTGQTVYSEAELVAVTGFKPGSESSLGELRAMASKISDYYHKNGYIVAQAYVPAQDIKDGAVTIAVLEGRYGKIMLRNQSNLKDSQANRVLEGLKQGDLITIAPLEERLVLLADTPGVNVRSTLSPGAAVGTSDLLVDVTSGRRVTGSVEADNAGNRYTGEYRVGATVNINNPTGNGDQATLRALTSGSGLTYARASYQMQFGKAMAGVAYSWVEYELGKEFSSLRAHGTADIISVYGGYPLIRSRNTNLYALLDFDYKTFQDKIDAANPPSVTDKKAQVLMGSLYGDHRDGFGGGGLTAYSLTWTTGDIDIRTPDALARDAATARSNGNFNKLGYHASRLQNLGGPFSLYGGIRGQFASKNLDISEKMELGGMYAVRAYPEGEAYADEGYVVNVEARMLLPKFSQLPGQTQLIAFVDTGSVRINENPWTAGQNRRTLSGAGVGINWFEHNNFVVRAYYAHKLGNAVAISAPDRSNRFWIQLVKYF